MLKKIAIVGYGYWGPNLLRNFSNNLDCEVLYCCDLDIVKLKKVRKAYPSIMLTKNYEDILNDSEVDAVVIATPTKFHHPLAKAALESGKDVLIEEADAGHFIHDKNIVKFDERVVHGQCSHCNRHLRGNLALYAVHMVKDYGQATVEELLAIKNLRHKFKREELEQIRKDCALKISKLL